jgi:predicted amidophosphoribosyltransferase
MKVKWMKDTWYDARKDKAINSYIPQCPACKKAPTYGMDRCPYCDQELEYDYEELNKEIYKKEETDEHR